MEAFATYDDYESRYGEADESRVTVLLDDASVFLASEMARARREIDPTDELQQGTLNRVCCRIVHDQMATSDQMAGVSQTSWAATPYSGSYTFANPSGKVYLYRDERRQLGISGGRVGSVPPIGEAS